MEVLHTFLAGEQLAIRGKNRGDTHQILRGDARITQRQFERSQPLAVFPHSLGEENPLRNHVFAQFTCPPQGDRKSTRLNSSHRCISYAVFCLKKKKKNLNQTKWEEKNVLNSRLGSLYN